MPMAAACASSIRHIRRPAYIGMPTISLSPDGSQAAFGVDDAVWVVDLDGGEARMITDQTGFVWAVAWSPTGEWITYTRFHGNTSVVSLVRPDGTDDREISAPDETDEANASVWSPDGKLPAGLTRQRRDPRRTDRPLDHGPRGQLRRPGDRRAIGLRHLQLGAGCPLTNCVAGITGNQWLIFLGTSASANRADRGLAIAPAARMFGQ